jgi:hypothetical protein
MLVRTFSAGGKVANLQVGIRVPPARSISVWTSEQEQDIAVSTSSKHKIFSAAGKWIHPMWLRERCLSADSVQEATNQPLHQPHTFVWPMRIDKATLIPSSDDFDGTDAGATGTLSLTFNECVVSFPNSAIVTPSHCVQSFGRW